MRTIDQSKFQSESGKGGFLKNFPGVVILWLVLAAEQEKPGGIDRNP